MGAEPAPRAMRRRLFVAVDLDEKARAMCAAVAERLRSEGWPGKWVAPPNYHLTIAFLGGVDADRVAEVIGAIRDVAPALRPFDVVLDTAGAFPNERRPRVAWVGSAQPVPAFATLCGVVRSSLAALGFSFDRHADPHVTIARAERAPPLPSLEVPARLTVRVDTLTVYQSFTEPSGARYEALERLPLGR